MTDDEKLALYTKIVLDLIFDPAPTEPIGDWEVEVMLWLDDTPIFDGMAASKVVFGWW